MSYNLSLSGMGLAGCDGVLSGCQVPVVDAAHARLISCIAHEDVNAVGAETPANHDCADSVFNFPREVAAFSSAAPRGEAFLACFRVRSLKHKCLAVDGAVLLSS